MKCSEKPHDTVSSAIELATWFVLNSYLSLTAITTLKVPITTAADNTDLSVWQIKTNTSENSVDPDDGL